MTDISTEVYLLSRQIINLILADINHLVVYFYYTYIPKLCYIIMHVYNCIKQERCMLSSSVLSFFQSSEH